jgi:hypothetical protein
MTSYHRKPTTFDELQVQSTTDHQDVQAFFGESYNYNRLSIIGAGFVGTDFFAIIIGGMDLPNGNEVLYVSTGGYIRVERRGDGKAIGITTAPDALAADPDFSAA